MDTPAAPVSAPSVLQALAAGALAGLAGLAVFAALHWTLILPIWEIAYVGLLPVTLGGLAVGWAFHELVRSGALPRRPWQGIAFGFLMWLTLAAPEALVLAWGPLHAISTGTLTGADVAKILAALASAFPAGTLLGWLLTRRWRSALIVGLAAFALALTIGHNVPAFGARPRAPLMFAIILAVEVVAGLVLAEIRFRLAGTGRVVPEGTAGQVA